MQVVERDGFGPESAKALLDLGVQHLRAAVSGATDAALGGHDDRFGDGGESGGDRLFAVAAGVRVCRVDHLHAGGDRGLDERDAIARFRQPVGAEPDASHIDVAELHGLSLS